MSVPCLSEKRSALRKVLRKALLVLLLMTGAANHLLALTSLYGFSFVFEFRSHTTNESYHVTKQRSIIEMKRARGGGGLSSYLPALSDVCGSFKLSTSRPTTHVPPQTSFFLNTTSFHFCNKKHPRRGVEGAPERPTVFRSSHLEDFA